MDKVLEIDPYIDLDRLDISGFLGDLLPVTLGNIVGGALMVAIVYRLIIVLPRSIKKSRKKPKVWKIFSQNLLLFPFKLKTLAV